MAKPLPYQIVKNARDLIADGRRWTTGTLARTSSGWPCGPTSEHAAVFCALGAISRSISDLGLDPTRGAGRRLAKQAVRAVGRSAFAWIGATRIEAVNDDALCDGRRSQHNVVTLFDRYLEKVNA